MHRLHIPSSELHGPDATARGEAVSYLKDVLRLRPGAAVEVFDGEGHAFPATLDRYIENGAVLTLGARFDLPLPGVRLTLLQGLPKGDKFEWIVQKSVELGASVIVPVQTERSIVRLDGDKAVNRVERWQKIADEAARQCGRADLLRIDPVSAMGPALAAADATNLRFVLDEEEKGTRLRDVLKGSNPSAGMIFLVGPEGGLTREEVDQAKRAGFVAVTLGPRILRTETVALAVLSIAQHVLGDLG